MGDIRDVNKRLAALVADAQQIYTDLNSPQPGTSALGRFLGRHTPSTENLSGILEGKKVRPLRPLMNDLRVIKSDAEIQNMRRAGRASGASFTDTMEQSFKSEKELQAFVLYQFQLNGCDGPAFEPVVASGHNGLSIHYVRNDGLIQPESLVLTDAGGTYGGYVSDITRTWPADGKMTDAQRDLYGVVLSVQKACIAECRQPQSTTLDSLHQMAERMLKEELTQLGFDLTRSTVSDLMATLFPHHLSHHVGLDLHDCVGYSKKAPLRPGNCITIEPGVYVPAEPDERFPSHFRGMGIRIEDSICIREDREPIVLTDLAVKEVKDIEQLRT